MHSTIICLYNKQCWLLGWLFGDHLLSLRDFEPYVIFMNVCVVTTVTIVCDNFLLRDFEIYGIIL
jgi:hypothetical protein